MPSLLWSAAWVYAPSSSGPRWRSAPRPVRTGDHYSRMALSPGLERSATALVNSLLLAVDLQNYEFARQCPADTVHFDTISLGGPARDFTANEMTAGLRSTFRYLSGTQHLITAPVV